MEGVFALNAFIKNNQNAKRFIRGVAAIAAAFFILLTLTAPVFAQDYPPELNINLQINASWGGGDILNLDITDMDTGERQQMAIRLSEFIGEDENAPYILLQAMDLLGERQSGVIQIENPLYIPGKSDDGQTVGNSGSSVGVNELPDNLQGMVGGAEEPEPPTLTPDGAGTVVDNIMTINDIEFFTVTTENGNEFFLVIDRQRQSDNVYLLNTVTEADLMALAEARGEPFVFTSPPASAVQEPEPPTVPTMEEILQAIQESSEQNQQTQAPPPPSGSSGVFILIAIVLLLVGIAFLVIKLLIPKILNSGKDSQEDIEDEEYYGDEYADESGTSSYDSVEVDEDEDYGESGESEGFKQDSGYDGDGITGEGFGDSRGDADDEN